MFSKSDWEKCKCKKPTKAEACPRSVTILTRGMVEVTGRPMAGVPLTQLGCLDHAAIESHRTPGVEAASPRGGYGARHVPLQDDAVTLQARLHQRHSRQQCTCVGVSRHAEDARLRSDLDDLAEISGFKEQRIRALSRYLRIDPSSPRDPD